MFDLRIVSFDEDIHPFDYHKLNGKLYYKPRSSNVYRLVIAKEDKEEESEEIADLDELRNLL